LTNRQGLVLAGLIVLITVVAYVPSIRGGFVWDDGIYITGNPLVKASDGLCRCDEHLHSAGRAWRRQKLFADGSTPPAFKLTRYRLSPNGLIVGRYVREGEIKTGDTTLDFLSEREIARRKRMKREG
jgi:hypothetical protein